MEQRSTVALGALVLLAILVIFFLAQDDKNGQDDKDGQENYGGPPGTARAVTATELGQRGWADSPPLFVAKGRTCGWDLKQGRQARSASGILASVERTA